MKKVLFISVFLMGMLGNVFAQMVIFEGSFDEAMKKAKEEKKDLSWIFTRIGADLVR